MAYKTFHPSDLELRTQIGPTDRYNAHHWRRWMFENGPYPYCNGNSHFDPGHAYIEARSREVLRRAADRLDHYDIRALAKIAELFLWVERRPDFFEYQKDLRAGQSAASKAGMIGMSKSLAQEVASRGITVNTVAPGFIETAMTEALPEAQREKLLDAIPASRLGTAEDVAAAVLYLASDAAAYVTGQTLHVNGGMAMI